jgi:hypothetical protein
MLVRIFVSTPNLSGDVLCMYTTYVTLWEQKHWLFFLVLKPVLSNAQNTFYIGPGSQAGSRTDLSTRNLKLFTLTNFQKRPIGALIRWHRTEITLWQWKKDSIMPHLPESGHSIETPIYALFFKEEACWGPCFLSSSWGPFLLQEKTFPMRLLDWH